METSNVIRFDWAIKRLLRNKANFVVLEGFLSTLMNEKITIQNLLESESNQDAEFDKYNRVDLLAENSQKELILIEVQNNNEYAYFQRMLFGTSKLITEYLHRGENYAKVRKVYSVNIVYFALGIGKDVVYHGTTEFRGINEGDVLNLSPFQQKQFKVSRVSEIFPEYYILRINDFNKVAKSPLEEWIAYLKTGDIPADAKAQGLPEAREKLRLDQMSRDELKSYYKHVDNLVILRDNIDTERREGREEGRLEGREEGRFEGREEGLEEGREEGRLEGEYLKQCEIARKAKQKGMLIEDIADLTGLPADLIGTL